MTGYAEFAVTTNFSFLRGASHGEELVLQAKKLGLAGLGVADRNSVAGVVRAHQAAKEAGLPFAPGARLVFCDGNHTVSDLSHAVELTEWLVKQLRAQHHSGAHSSPADWTQWGLE
jgi:DNA polymerase III alpha subunit